MRYIANYFFKKIKVNNFLLEKLEQPVKSATSVPVFVLRLRGWLELNFIDFVLNKYFDTNICSADKYYKLSSVNRKKLEQCVENGKPVIVFLKRGKNDKEVSNIFSTLKFLGKKTNKEILIIPATILWRKLARRIKSPLKKAIFGDDRYPSWFQKFLFLLLYCSDAVFEVDNIVNLNSIHADTNSFDKTVKARIYKQIVKLDKGIVGPLVRQRERLIRLVLKDKKLNSIIDSLVEVSGESKKEYLKTARKMLFEISADYRESNVNRFRAILNWAWPKIIEGFWINEKMIEKYREMSKEAPALILPCHRSHADYLIVSFLFYKYNLMIPYIAAGINLSFFPMGLIFRRSGAYFIRRTFRGEKLYPYVLEAYVKRLLLDGTPQEFFPEGTRSRTGKMLHPKTGLLSFNLNAIREGYINDILIAPLSVVYGRLLESGAYLKEAKGHKKQKEDAKGVVKLVKLLGKKFGKVYFNLSEPFYLSDYFKENNIDIKNLSDSEYRQLTVRLGYKFIRDIQNATVITPIALISLILLSDIKKGITVDSLNLRIGYALKYLGDDSKLPGQNIEEFTADLHKAIAYLKENNKINQVNIEGKEIFHVNVNERNYLEYYKNNIVHYFLNASFTCLSILAMKKNPVSALEVYEEFKFLKKVFEKEFVYDYDTTEFSEMEKVLDKMTSLRILQYGNNEIAFDSNGLLILKNIAGIAISYIEAYYTVIDSYYSISRDNDKLPPSIYPLIINRGKLLFEMGDIKRKESINKFYYQNAHQWLNKQGYVNWNNLFPVLGKKKENEDTVKYFNFKQKLKDYIDSVFK
jgi:glycerol-3-phosphate O-acyltransferase